MTRRNPGFTLVELLVVIAIIVDSWGHPLFYDCHKPEGKTYAHGRIHHNADAFDLFSLGPDGRTSSSQEQGIAHDLGEAPDDINNWRP